MIEQSERNQVRTTTRRAALTTTPEGDTTIKETAQNLSGLKALLVKDIADSDQKAGIVREVEDVEKKQNYIINSPENFKTSRTREIQDVLLLLP